MFVNLLDILHPVGSLYTSFNPDSPAEIIGGTWTQIINKCLRAANDIDSGGADSVTLTINQIPSHAHSINIHRSGDEIPGCGLRNSNTVASWFTDRVMLEGSSGINSYFSGGGAIFQQFARLSEYLCLEKNFIKLVMPNGIY